MSNDINILIAILLLYKYCNTTNKAKKKSI